MEGDGREISGEDRELITPLLAQRKEETRWLSWYKEQINKKKTELRIVAVGKFRVFFFAVEEGKKKKEAKLVRDAHLLELQEINSKGADMVQLVFRPFTIELTDLAVDEAITAVRQSFEMNFFAMPKQRRFKLGVEPESRLKPVEGPNQAALAKSCGAFSGTYSAFCDFYKTPIRVDICWDMDNLLPANHVKEFDMKEFEQPLTPSDFRCLVEALHFNTHFTGFVAYDYKLDKDAMKLVADMLQVNEKMENLVLHNADGNAAGFELLGQAIAKNKKSAITTIDWAFNSVQDKGVTALGAALAALGHGISSLNLDHGDASKKGTVVLCNSLKSNAQMARTLQTLNLAYNRLDADGSNSLASFLSAPNALRELNVAYTNANLEVVFPALMRGSSELVTLNVAGNKMTPNGGAQLKTFLASASKLRDLNLADTAIPVNIVRDVLKSLIANRYFSQMAVNLSSNKLGVLGANMINGIAEEIACIEKLLLSDNDFGDEGISILAEGLSKCTSIKDLNIADNFTKGKTKTRNQALDAVIDLISSDCPVERLNMSASSTGFAIGEDMAPFIYALATNDSLVHLDISGHMMGDKGGIALGKALQTNRTLQSLLWDGNGTLLTGFNGFKIGLERNSVLTNMPLPIIDISGALKLQSGDIAKIQTVVSQISEAIARNQSPKSKFSSVEGFSQHITLGGAVEREELQKLTYRIKGQTAQPDNEQKKALRDADENDTYIAELHAIQEEMSQALEDELASKLGHFAGELAPFLGNIHRQLADRLVNTVKSKYQSVDQDTLVKLRAELDRYSVVDKDAISRVLAVSAAQQISSQVTKSFVNTVESASDAVFDHLLDRLEDIYYALSGTQRETPAQSEPEEKVDEPPPASGPPKKLPPVPPAKGRKPPPVVPPKGPKPGPPLGGSGGTGPRAPLPSPKGTPDIPKVNSGITHMTKDRPLGPAQRRRPQRKPQRRPMMEGNE